MEIKETTNQGILYENKINALLKKHKIQSKSFRGAGTDQNRPDCEIVIKDKTYYVEIKHSVAKDFGQIPLHYDTRQKWFFSEKTSVPELVEKFVKIGVLKKINRMWSLAGPPRKFTIPKENFKLKDRDYDKRKFREIFVDIPLGSVAEYYNSKDVYYIQIGGYGLYYLGKNPLKLSIPEFDVPLQLRARFKPKDNVTYSFMCAIQMKKGSTLEKSNLSLDDKDHLKYLQSLNEKK